MTDLDDSDPERVELANADAEWLRSLAATTRCALTANHIRIIAARIDTLIWPEPSDQVEP